MYVTVTIQNRFFGTATFFSLFGGTIMTIVNRMVVAPFTRITSPQKQIPFTMCSVPYTLVRTKHIFMEVVEKAEQKIEMKIEMLSNGNNR